MNIKQTIIILSAVLTIALGLVAFQPVSANAAKCGQAETSIISCSSTPCKDGTKLPKKENGLYKGKCKDGSDPNSSQNSSVWALLLLALNIMTAGVGIVGIGGIVYGAILYASAGDRSGQIEQARTVITNVIIGLVAFALMWAFLQFLIPGGIFS